MADDNGGSNSPPPRARRSSFAGETFATLFGGHRGSMSRPNESNNTNGQQPTQQYPGPITSAAAQAQRRRLSISTLGLSGSPNSSPFGSYDRRSSSYGTAGSDSIDESAIEDEPATGPTPQTPFAQRMSFSAKALRDVKTGNGGNGGGANSPGQNGTSQPASVPENNAPATYSGKAQNGTILNRDAKGRGSEGFNWSDNFRNRAERTSISHNAFGSHSPPARHDRSKSVAVMEPPLREIPKPKEQVRPDHFQERILKGDFYMD